MYLGISKNLDIGLTAVSSIDFSKLKPATYQLSNGLFYSLSEYTSKDISEAKLEAHRKYIDIQFIVSGEEKIGYKFNNELQIASEYNEETDLKFFDGYGELFTLKKNHFAVFFPQDAHAPQIAVDEPSNVIKVVVKVPV